jgi:hypothetical protein
MTPGTLLKTDKRTIAVETAPERKIRVLTTAWAEPVVIAADEVLEVRIRQGQVHKRSRSAEVHATVGAALKRSLRAFAGGLHISDDGLPTVINVDVLDANMLVATMAETTECLDLHRISSQQSRRHRCKCDHSTLTPIPTSEPRKNRRGGSVCARHLDCKRANDLILRGGSFHHREGGVQADF